MTFKVVAPSKVFQCLFFKIVIHIDLPENQTFLDEQLINASQKLHESRYTSTFIFLHLLF